MIKSSFVFHITWEFFINILSRGILTLSKPRKPLLVPFIPSLVPISPIFIPENGLFNRKFLIFLSTHQQCTDKF